ncbi:MAG: EVE domain-containing protein [Acidobacteria bacterium]|nr:EVE domain-containing protein [Acidobacteriota bacterium]MCW5967176.1 EVE domain-containing protein [Blastocatellales bacterium]
MSRQWLFKTEPSEYSFSDLEKEKKAVWDGVTNNLALKHLRAVRMGDEILIYHSGDEKAIVGIAQAISDPYPHPREDDDKLMIINLIPKRRLARPITLAEIKIIEEFKDFDLIRLPRLSVMPVADDYWDRLQDMMTFV